MRLVPLARARARVALGGDPSSDKPGVAHSDRPRYLGG